MSRHHAHLIRTIFTDPPSHNVHWREIESLLKHVGATLESLSGARLRVTIGRIEEIVHRPHHGSTMNAQSILHLRAFLARAGVTPSQYESKDEGPTPGGAAG